MAYMAWSLAKSTNTRKSHTQTQMQTAKNVTFMCKPNVSTKKSISQTSEILGLEDLDRLLGGLLGKLDDWKGHSFPSHVQRFLRRPKLHILINDVCKL